MKTRRTIKGNHPGTEILVKDDPNEHSKANHIYYFPANNSAMNSLIIFQNGPVKEKGVNGIHEEDLINIIIDRLKCFQTSRFKCKENVTAIQHLELALAALNLRTKKRVERGVEGKNII